MHKHHEKNKRSHPWRDLRGGLWLVGLGFLFLTGKWWPGILVLIGISLVLDGAWAWSDGPSSDDLAQPPAPAPVPVPIPVAPPPLPISPLTLQPEHPFEQLPQTCPRCGGPVRKPEVRWTGSKLALCAYCGAGLSLGKDNSQGG